MSRWVRRGAGLPDAPWRPGAVHHFIWVDSKRKRQVFPSLTKAIEEAKTAGGQLNKGDLGSAELSAVQRVGCVRALEVLAPTGVPIEVAAGQIARAMSRLKGRVSLDTVIDSYLSGTRSRLRQSLSRRWWRNCSRPRKRTG